MDRIGVSHSHLAKQQVSLGGVVPVAEKFQPEIPYLMREQDEVLSRILSLLDALEARVGSVLSPAQVSPADARSCDAASATELGSQLRSSISRMYYVADRLEDVVSRIHL
jgi:hypothetical protein